MNTAFLAGYMHKESRDVSLITGNPKYIKDNPDASRFYSKLQSILEGKGYKVRRDPGEEFTAPPETDHAWIGHSRGTDRLRFAPDNVRTVGVGAPMHEGSINHPEDDSEVGKTPGKAHYKLTPDMVKKILARLER